MQRRYVYLFFCFYFVLSNFVSGSNIGYYDNNPARQSSAIVPHQQYYQTNQNYQSNQYSNQSQGRQSYQSNGLKSNQSKPQQSYQSQGPQSYQSNGLTLDSLRKEWGLCDNPNKVFDGQIMSFTPPGVRNVAPTAFAPGYLCYKGAYGFVRIENPSTEVESSVYFDATSFKAYKNICKSDLNINTTNCCLKSWYIGKKPLSQIVDEEGQLLCFVKIFVKHHKKHGIEVLVSQLKIPNSRFGPLLKRYTVCRAGVHDSSGLKQWK